MKNLFSLAWEFAAVGASRFGGKKSQYFASALKQVNQMVKQGKEEDDIKKEIYEESLFVPFEKLPKLRYNNYFSPQSGNHELTSYTEGGGYGNFWFVNSQGLSNEDDIYMSKYLQFTDGENAKLIEFLEDTDVIRIINAEMGGYQDIRYIERYNRFVYGRVYDKLMEELGEEGLDKRVQEAIYKMREVYIDDNKLKESDVND